jgi:hypothetical protein
MLLNFNHLTEAKSNYWHHFKYSGLCTIYAGAAFLLGIVHTIFPFIGDWWAIKMTEKIVDTTNEQFKHRVPIL